MAFRIFRNMFTHQPKRLNLYKAYCSSLNSEQRLKENPYYDKYADKIAELQKISPAEFKEMLDEKLSPSCIKSISTVKGGKSGSERTRNPPRFHGQKDLNQIMKLETLEDKSAEEIEFIWKQYHQTKDGLYAVLPKKSYETMCSSLQLYPVFLFPLPRDHGYEFIVHQFVEHTCYFTSLINFQAFKENAPVSLTITYFTELLESKGIVLMRGEFDDKVLKVQEAQCLANQLQLYYGEQQDKKKENLLWTFNNTPESFKHMDLISNFEYDFKM